MLTHPLDQWVFFQLRSEEYQNVADSWKMRVEGGL